MNVYGYVGGDPVNGIDPEGKFISALVGCAMGAVGGYLAADAYVEAQNERAKSNFEGESCSTMGDTNKPLVDAAGKVADVASSFGKQASKALVGAALMAASGSTSGAVGAGCSALGIGLGLAFSDGTANNTVSNVMSAISSIF